MATVLAALIGAVLGSIGSQLVADRLRRQGQDALARQQANEKYLLQLQDGLESLLNRLLNVDKHGGLGVMTDQYYVESTLYAIGIVLAHKRRLLLDGVYAQLERQAPPLGRELRTHLERIEQALGQDNEGGNSFQRYSRQLLAEAVLEQWTSGWTVVTYLAFQERRAKPNIAEALEPAAGYVQTLTSSTIDGLVDSVRTTLDLVTARTGLPPSSVYTSPSP